MDLTGARPGNLACAEPRNLPDKDLGVIVATIAVAAAVVVLLIVVAFQIGRLRKARKAVDRAWAEIDGQLVRRNELVPVFVETVKLYAPHERAALDAVVQTLGTMVAAPTPVVKAHADHSLNGALKALLAVTDSHPDLQANQTFRQIRAEFCSIDDKLAYARGFYNDGVTRLNTRAARFPAKLFAGMAKATRREHFEPAPVHAGLFAVGY